MAEEGKLDRKFRLSEKDRQEVIRAVEGGKPLDDRFRFLLFGDKRQVELVWNGKTTETCRVVLPFQTIERVDEPRAERIEDTRRQDEMVLLDERGRQEGGWTNKLIWGDNKLILASLKSPQWREAIRAEGGLKLIYIDPPFDVGLDFSMQVEVGEGGETVEKAPGVLEQIAYRDTWGQGQDSFIAMLYERLSLMRDLLAEDGSIYVHCDYRVNSYIRLMMDEIFGKDNFRNEIIWYYRNATMQRTARTYARKNQNIFFYSKQKNTDFVPPRSDSFTEDILNRFGKIMEENGDIKYKNAKNEKSLLTRTIPKFKKEYGRLPNDEDVIHNIKFPKISSVWDDVPQIRGNNDFEHLGYPTQKPLALLERIIEASSNEGDLVAGFLLRLWHFRLKSAERTGRKWIASDLGKFAIHTTRKRMLKTQRDLKENRKSYRAFEILNLGKYERQFYLKINPNLNERTARATAQRAGKELSGHDPQSLSRPLPPQRASLSRREKRAHGRRRSYQPPGHPPRPQRAQPGLPRAQDHQHGCAGLRIRNRAGGATRREHPCNTSISINLKYIPAEVFDKRVTEKKRGHLLRPRLHRGDRPYRKRQSAKKPLAKNFSKNLHRAEELCQCLRHQRLQRQRPSMHQGKHQKMAQLDRLLVGRLRLRKPTRNRPYLRTTR